MGILYGLGNGLCAKAVIDRLEEKDCLIIYEPSIAILSSVLEQIDLRTILEKPNVYLIVPDINGSMFQQLLYEKLDFDNIEGFVVFEHPQYANIFTSNYEEYRKLILDCVDSKVVDRNTKTILGEKFVQNILYNTKYYDEVYDIKELKKLLPTDYPYIIVAAGPSLDLNVDQLKHVKGKAVIACVDRALGTLKEYGIEPDLVFAIDPRKEVRFCGGEAFSYPLICTDMTSKDIMDVQNGRKIFCSPSNLMGNYFGRQGFSIPTLAQGGSVATLAFSVGIYLGFEKIVFVGQDLAYRGGMSHSGIQQAPKQKVIREYYVEDINGDTVKTEYDWYKFLKWFERRIIQYPNVKFIDATEGGAKIQGTTIMTLSETIDRYISKNDYVDITGALSQMKPFNVNGKRNFQVEIKNKISKEVEFLSELLSKADGNVQYLLMSDLRQILEILSPKALKVLSNKQGYEKEKIEESYKEIEKVLDTIKALSN